jgi:ElaB/YqjD/DUF883 family membrane-anchored ribosome-binding protein
MLTSHPSAGAQKKDLHVGGLGASASAPLAAVTDNIHEVADSWLEKARDAVRDADDYVHSNPWQALAVVALVGLTAGYLLARRTSSDAA